MDAVFGLMDSTAVDIGKWMSAGEKPGVAAGKQLPLFVTFSR